MTTELTPSGQELLDDLQADPELVRESLRNIARANYWFGGLAAVRYGLRHLLRGEAPPRLVILDVGTGAGDIPRDLVRAGRRIQVDVRAIGLERHPAAARVARASGLATILADGRLLPVRSGSVDVVVASQVAHHLEPSEIMTLAREASRVARVGVIIADLRRSSLAAIGFRIGSRMLRFDANTRADGVMSVRRGFEPTGLRRLLAAAGVKADVVARPVARVVATWRTDRT